MFTPSLSKRIAHVDWVELEVTVQYALFPSPREAGSPMRTTSTGLPEVVIVTDKLVMSV